MRSIVFSCLVLLDLVHAVWPSNVLTILMAGVTAMALILALPQAKGTSRWMSIALLGVSVPALAVTKAPLDAWVAGINAMGNIVVFIMLLQIMAFPIQLGGYSEGLKAVLLKYFRRERPLYFATCAFSFLVGGFVVSGSLPISYYAMQPLADSVARRPKKFLATAMLRGYCASILWTPTAVYVGVALAQTGVSWVRFLPWALLMSAIVIILTVVAEMVKGYGKKPLAAKAEAALAESAAGLAGEEGRPWMPLPQARRTAVAFVGIFALLITAINLFTHWSGLDIIHSMSIVIVFFSSIWAFLLGAGRSYTRKICQHFGASLASFSSLVALLISVGLFGQAVKCLGVDAYFAHGFEYVARLSPALLTGSFELFVFLLALLGVHPILSIVLMRPAHLVSLFGLSPELTVLALVAGSAVSYIVSPFSSTTFVMSGLTGETPVTVGLKWNGLFSALFMAVSVSIIILLSTIVGFAR